MAITASVEKRIEAVGLIEEDAFAGLPAGVLLAISAVSPNDYNPKQCSDDRLVRIAESIKLKGWVPSEVCLVWRDPDCPTEYRIINGEHRWLICKIAGFTHFPAYVAEAVTTREDAMALGMALEEAVAGRDHKKWTDNLLHLATRGKDEDLRKLLRVKDPEQLRQDLKYANAAGQEFAKSVARNTSRPKLVTLTFTGDQYDAYQAALGNAKTRLKMATETIGMLKELAERDVVAIAAVLRNGEE